MTEYFIKNLQMSFEEFQKLLLSDKYINKKTFDAFLDKYNDTFDYIIKNNIKLLSNDEKKIKSIMNDGYKVIELRNKKYVDKKLVEYKEYFDNLFKNIDPEIILDEEQRRAIIIDEDYSLVIAGAGAGKTTTMAAKVKYLVEKCQVEPQKIILLAYTNKASEELETRINKDFNLNVEVLTFHKLGMKFLRKLFNHPIKIVEEGTLYNIVDEYFKEKIFINKKELKKFVYAFDEYISLDDSIFRFDNFETYFDYYVKSKYIENKNNIEQYIDETIKRRQKNLKTINGEKVKSVGEFRIANFLYRNGIEYKYENMYPHKVGEDRSMSPDFCVCHGELKYWIEYFGMYSKDKDKENKEYNKQIKDKEKLHQKYGSDLIEIYPTYDDGKYYIEVLKEKILEKNIPLKPRSDKEIFEKLLYTNQSAQYFKFIDLTIEFIKRFKEQGCHSEYFDKLMMNINDEKILIQLSFMKKIFIYYNKKIHSQYKIDFEDMINEAYEKLDYIKERDQSSSYDYVIIDEYQDISKQRYNFSKKLSDLFDAKIVAVGDDWQSIYSFSGSEVDLFTDFYKYMGYAEITKITNTYRNSQELIDVAGEFIGKNTQQFSKNLVSNKHIEKPIEINYFEYGNNKSKANILEKILQRLYNQNPKHKILLLGRYNSDIDDYIDLGLFRPIYNDSTKVIYKKNPEINIDFMTVHSSKGLGYDQVIILNALNGLYGFPSQIEDYELIKLLSKQRVEFIEYPEERRLFYVALTRTKNKVYILCPYLPYSKRSEFINEISDNVNVEKINNT